MKRLLTLAALAVVTIAASGCWHWFNRGPTCNTCGQPSAYGDAYLMPPPSTGETLPGPAY